MAKDAKGHGSEKRGGGSFDNINAQRVAQGFKPMAESRRGIHDFLDYMAGDGPMPDAMKSVLGGPSDTDAAKALAGGGAKSAPVDTHPSMGGKPVGQMKMSASDFAALRTAVTPHLATTADPSHSAMRQRWDAMHKSGFDTRPLYKAGLNDDHIDTALRRIQGR